MYSDPSPVDDVQQQVNDVESQVNGMAEHPQSGDIVTLSTTVSAPLNYSTTATSYEQPTTIVKRSIADWTDVSYPGISNYFIRWGLYSVSETTDGQTSYFHLYGFGDAPGTITGSEFSVAGADGSVFRQMNQVSVNPDDFGVWTPVPRFRTDGGEANLRGVLTVLLMGEVA